MAFNCKFIKDKYGDFIYTDQGFKANITGAFKKVLIDVKKNGISKIISGFNDKFICRMYHENCKNNKGLAFISVLMTGRIFDEFWNFSIITKSGNFTMESEWHKIDFINELSNMYVYVNSPVSLSLSSSFNGEYDSIKYIFILNPDYYADFI